MTVRIIIGIASFLWCGLCSGEVKVTASRDYVDRKITAATNDFMANVMVITNGVADTNYVNSSISTNNAAFVAAVTNCPVVISDPLDGWGEYGTLGALLVALVTAIAALRRGKVDKNEVSLVEVTDTTPVSIALSDRKFVDVYVTTPSGRPSITVSFVPSDDGLFDAWIRIRQSGGSLRTSITWPSDGTEQNPLIVWCGESPQVALNESGTFHFVRTPDGKYLAERPDRTGLLFGKWSDVKSTVNGGGSSFSQGHQVMGNSSNGTLAVGYGTFADHNGAFAQGFRCWGNGIFGVAMGAKAAVGTGGSYSFTWQGALNNTDLNTRSIYTSHGPGTFNVNPADGLDGFWIGNTRLSHALRYEMVSPAVVAPSLPETAPEGIVPRAISDSMFPIVATDSNDDTYTQQTSDGVILSYDDAYDAWHVICPQFSEPTIDLFFDKVTGVYVNDIGNPPYAVTFNGVAAVPGTSPALPKAMHKVALSDLAVNAVTLGSDVSSCEFTFPSKTQGRARDFFLRLTLTGETLPTLTFVEPGGSPVAFDVDDDSWAEIEQGVNVLMFSDTSEASA